MCKCRLNFLFLKKSQNQNKTQFSKWAVEKIRYELKSELNDSDFDRFYELSSFLTSGLI